MRPKLVIGAPVWDRSWYLPVWFDSVEANVDRKDTGLIFVVPPSDSLSREVIADRATGYKFVEVIRDPYEAQSRDVRRQDNFATLAAARNLLLHQVNQIQPDWFLSWDSDFLIPPHTLDMLRGRCFDMSGVWAWLNRQPPHRGQHWDGEQFVSVEWNDPVSTTAMKWETEDRPVAVHFDPREWRSYSSGCYEVDVVLAWQLMSPLAYSTSKYAPHPHGEDIPFNWGLHQRGIKRWMNADVWGVHLFDRPSAEVEVKEGYPLIMRHAHDLPLAAQREVPESELLSLIGYFPAE